MGAYQRLGGLEIAISIISIRRTSQYIPCDTLTIFIRMYQVLGTDNMGSLVHQPLGICADLKIIIQHFAQTKKCSSEAQRDIFHHYFVYFHKNDQ